MAQDPNGGAASREDLQRWVEQTTGTATSNWHQISGGNRCHSWAVDAVNPNGGGTRALYIRYQPPRPPSVEPYTVWREAKFYEALQGSAVPAPKLIAINPDFQAIITERVPGRADFRRISEEHDRATVAREFIEAIVTLHKLPVEPGSIPGLEAGATMADCVRNELDIWRDMYRESGRTDPLIDLALDWLYQNIPDPPGKPVFVHGDAGPGNFLFDKGHLTALLDWELAHAGDPMEDLAWFSMRCVMEPVPDFAERIREYEKLSGAPVDAARIRYHRVFVSTRIVIIRHRNVTGQPGNSIISRALNRRLLGIALAEANGINLPEAPKITAEPTAQTTFYDSVLNDLRDEIASATKDSRVIMATKNAAKVLKYLRDVDRLGATVESGELAALETLLGQRPNTAEAGRGELLQAMRDGRVSFKDTIKFFAASTQREGALAASSSGALSTRQFPSLPKD